MVKRGDYLVNAMGCDGCHSPKRMGLHEPEIIPELRLSGFTSNGQFPKIFSLFLINQNYLLWLLNIQTGLHHF